MSYKVIIEEENDGRYSASCPGLPGCYSWGHSKKEALENIKEAIEGYLEVADELINEKLRNKKAVLEEITV
ncbi:MAG: type II toxin-antitoxin system HicB family antitoxin [Candidatus Stahlbacteria bacterium]|nr:type II toxin-antitoxin system HicB family antitoxin [Candidatus Stahlbacteria bacterium]